MDLDLLLAHADDASPALGASLPKDAAYAAPKPELKQPKVLLNRAGEQSDLRIQKWAVIVPATAAGDRLLEVIKPLIELRQEEQGAYPIAKFKVAPGGTEADAIQFRNNVLESATVGQANWPLYLLILGGFDGVSLAFQQVLAASYIVGRLAFPTEDGYLAYIAKVKKWHKNPYPDTDARALLYSVRDNTSATTIGYHSLMTPSLEQCRTRVSEGLYRAKEIFEVPSSDEPSSSDLFKYARSAEPLVLFSMSHGLGPPRGGWKSPEDQRAIQGAMSFGSGRYLEVSELAKGAFLPGGVWFYFACYGAGTPTSSVYLHWLKRLREAKGYDGRLDSVVSGLPKGEDAAFLGALPTAALANEDGPLAVMGHVDLAWTYSFQDPSKAGLGGAERFQGVFQHLLDGKRAGVAYKDLMTYGTQAAVDLSTRYGYEDDEQRGRASEPESPQKTLERASLWMLRHDIFGYVFLGDPAVRLPLTERAAAQPRRLTPNSLIGAGGDGASASAAATATAAGGRDVAKMEEAVLHTIRKDMDPRKVRSSAGVEKEELDRWVKIYMEAGRRALEEIK